MIPIAVGEKLVVTEIKEENVTSTGIIVTGEDYEKPRKGTIVSIGSGQTSKGHIRTLGVGVGDTVVFPHYSGTEISHEQKDYIILNFDDVLAAING